ncbi:peptidase C65 Otubain-domain-containing protein, partial [Hygrophoropsis aurantiaca]
FLNGFPIIPEDLDIADIPAELLYDLNQDLWRESVPDSPLIDALAPISVLRKEYENSSHFMSQIDHLSKEGYGRIRRARGDGDCFYRSLAYAFVDGLLRAPNRAVAAENAISSLKSTMASDQLKMAELFEGSGYDEWLENFTELIEKVTKVDDDRSNELLVLEFFQTPEHSNSTVAYLRFLTSAYIQNSGDSNLIQSMSMEPGQFCKQFVEPLGTYADDFQISALSGAMDISINIAYMDGHKPEVNFILKRPERSEPLLLLFRPGHYDVLVKDSPQVY